MKQISVNRLAELLDYNPLSGEIKWRVNRGKCKAGRVILCKNGSGYIVVRVDNVLVRAHRAAWALMTKEWPAGEIDHINGIRDDNRFENLRIVTHTQNMWNVKKPTTNKSGFKGVSYHRAGKCWQAHIKADGKNFYLGLFKTAEDAYEAYKKASTKLHNVFSNVK